MDRKRIFGSYLCALLIALPFTAHGVSFDPDGAGGVGPVEIDAFDVTQSSILNADGIAAVAEGPGGKLTSYNHGIIGTLTLDGTPVFTPGSLGHECEITVVLGLDTEITSVAGDLFTSAYNPTGTINFFEMWYDATCNADPLAGTGFNDGTLIMSGRFTSFFNAFLVTSRDPEPLDGLGTDDWTPVVSVSGTGSANNVRIMVESFDQAFFPDLSSGDMIMLTLQNYSRSLPFNNTNPSELYVQGPGGAAAALTPTMGANTGNDGSFAVNGIDGPDFLAQTDVNISLTAGPPPLAMLGDRVWEDPNADGIQDCIDTNNNGLVGDAGDVGPECGNGIPNVTVTLVGNPDGDAACDNGDESDIAVTATDADGFYEFLDLDPAQNYCVRFDQPSANAQLICDPIIGGATFSPQNSGFDDAIDSDADPITGQTGNISLTAGEFDRTWDAGLYCPAKIGDLLVDDRNRDGIQGPGEPGFTPGQLVELVKCENNVPGADVIDSQTTDGSGMYMFNPLPPGEYAVIFSKPDDYVFSPQNQGGDETRDCDTDVNGVSECVTLGPNEYNPDVDACINLPPAGLGDFVWEDKNVDGTQDVGEPGIGGVTVNLLLPGADGDCNTGDDVAVPGPGGTTTTAASGFYQFTDLDPGRYCVEFKLDSVPDDFCTTEGFPLGAPQFTLRNTGADDADSDADPATGRTGNIDLGPEEFDPTNDAGIYCPAKIGDRVWEDSNSDGLQNNLEPGVSDVEVQLFECGPDGIAGTDDDIDTGERRYTDSADGRYMFGAEPGVFDLAPGDYYVKFVRPFGRQFTAPDQGSDDEIDSDCRGAEGITSCIGVASRDINLSRDCGLIPPPPPDCDLVIDKTCRVETPAPQDFDKCKGKLQQFTVTWTGGDVTISGLPNDAPGGVVSTDQDVTFFGPFSSNDVFVDITGAQTGQSKFHMSCSDEDFNSPDDCGKLAGNGKSTSGFINIWRLKGFIDAEDRVLDCSGGSGTGFPEQDSCVFTPQPANCEVLDKPTSLTFRYTGQGCGASDNDQDPGKAECSGDVNGLLPVDVVAGKHDFSKVYTVTPASVASGAEFTITPADKFESDSRINITNAGGTESNRIHLSCSQPLAVGDKYGSLELVGFNGVGNGTEVVYGYEVTNTGDPLTGVTITDNILGQIAGPFGLGSGESQRFTKTGMVFETITNVATASGVLPAPGGECIAMDEVTVEVEEPPQPPVSCRDIKDITALSMVWNGPSGVDISTEGGQQFSDVQNGNQITFSTAGLGNDVDLTLSGAVNGSSRFHVSCSDDDMNGSEDCGSNQGNSKKNESGYINDWLFDGMTGERGSFACGLPNTGVVEPEAGGPSGGAVSGAAALDLGDDKKAKWELTNNGAQDVFITRVEVTWPSEHGQVKKFKLERDFAKDVYDATSPTVVPDEKAFESDANKRKLKAGDSRKLEIEFTEDYKDHVQGDYTITVEFDNGDTLSFP